ncbi:MAG TPA: hypothetical protein VMM12_06860 [Longimicrobiales bacterium]|nr:hypothetical protein [Longimicrobiales bacterium]
MGRLAALVLLPALWACDSQVAEPAPLRTRIFLVASADGQPLPAQHDCPAPQEGMVAGARFVEGELVLYPQQNYTWRYTIQQYMTVGGSEQVWEEPVTIQGTYALRGDSLDLVLPDDGTRTGRISGDVVELSEYVPCPFGEVDGTPHSAALQLAEVDAAD